MAALVPALLRALVVALAPALAACGDDLLAPPPVALPTEGPPAAFRMHVSGFGFGAHLVTLRGDTLVVERRPEFRIDSARITRVVPDADAWRRFWATAAEVGVANWPRDCPNPPRIADGGGFTLEIVAGGRTLLAQGTNNYPRRDGSCTQTPGASSDYQRFVDAVSRLIGRPFP